MRFYTVFLAFLLLTACGIEHPKEPFTEVSVDTVFEDSLSIRAIELMDNSLAFAANKGTFGSIDLTTNKIRTNVQKYDSVLPGFRAIAHTSTDFFMLSVGSPALLYKTGVGGMELVYKEEGEGVFYDAMTFWNNSEGIAIGDTVDGCLSIIITRDGGKSWKKIPCSDLPEGVEGEGAFAASNTNIRTVDNKTWIATTSSTIYFSNDKGQTWQLQQTPIVRKKPTQGIYSIDFYDENLGVAIGGDYTKPEDAMGNLAVTKDGGATWNLMADGEEPDYKSCIQFVPGTKGKGIVALGFTGISYSSDMGENWTELSKESFYTIRFKNDSIAYAAGKNRIARLTFK
nr:oxidoreductase [Maribacter sp. HTCC2170]